MATQLVRGSLFDDLFRDLQGLPGYFIKPLHSDSLPSSGQIRIDVKENSAAYTVYAELPGVSKDEIHVSIDGGVVTLRAEVKPVSEDKEGEKVLRAERFYGFVERSFQLAQDIDQAGAKAKYEQGVLTLTLPKKQASGAQRLAID
ncbi:MAG: Hsp20/alpha crystallin family protein [Burkholderiaceae bacterium]|jgi:HSP20 family protein|nr:Hsp20/alpha crystallin family protein [Burkholderiaceae bacterium]